MQDCFLRTGNKNPSHPTHQDPQQREKENSRLFSTSCCCDWWPKSPYPRFGKLMVVIPCVLPNLQYIDPPTSGLKDVGTQVRELLFRIGSWGPPGHYFSSRSFSCSRITILMFTASFVEKIFYLAVSRIVQAKMHCSGIDISDMWKRKFIFPRTLGGGSYPPKYLEEIWLTC